MVFSGVAPKEHTITPKVMTRRVIFVLIYSGKTCGTRDGNTSDSWVRSHPFRASPGLHSAGVDRLNRCFFAGGLRPHAPPCSLSLPGIQNRHSAMECSFRCAGSLLLTNLACGLRRCGIECGRLCKDCDHRRAGSLVECDRFWRRPHWANGKQHRFAEQQWVGGGPDLPTGCDRAVFLSRESAGSPADGGQRRFLQADGAICAGRCGSSVRQPHHRQQCLQCRHGDSWTEWKRRGCRWSH